MLCSLTDGNLSRHLAVLQEAGVVDVKKSFSGNRPQTWCKLTVAGRQRFNEYVEELERVVSDAVKLEGRRGGAGAGVRCNRTPDLNFTTEARRHRDFTERDGDWRMERGIDAMKRIGTEMIGF